MRNNPLVSVIIPSKNEENYIEKTLISIKNQSYKNTEIIIVDSSTDNTIKIAKKFTNKIIKKNVNIPKAKNLGTKHAKGDILLFVDADTILLPNCIERSLKFILNGSYDAIIPNVKPREKNFRAIILTLIYKWFLKLMDLTYNFSIGGCPVMVTKEFFNRIDGFNERFTCVEDLEFIKKLKIFGKVKIDKKILSIISLRRFEKDGYFKWMLRGGLSGLLFIIKNEPYYKDVYPIFR